MPPDTALLLRFATRVGTTRRQVAGILAIASIASITPTPVVATPSEAPGVEPVARIVSINLCADQLLLDLADARQLVSLSYLAHDPAASHHHARALEFPVNAGGAEPILALEPDAVIAADYSSHYTVKLLEASGLTVHRLPIARSVEAMLDNLLSVGEWIGQQERARQRVAALRERLERLAAMTSAPASPATDADATPLAAVYDPNGYTVGPGSLRGDLLRLAGFENVARLAGIDDYGHLPLESLLVKAPDVVIDSPFSPGTWSRAQALSSHPALRQRGLAPTIITLDSADTICAGPWSVDLVERLVKERGRIGTLER